mmetsp:Transcript_26073/g.52832  ORF Transcript_26073/g.52832 Transcript_26073/m.52832 type:complete len:208 (-) Transcript_26073:536-1159(-)
MHLQVLPATRNTIRSSLRLLSVPFNIPKKSIVDPLLDGGHQITLTLALATVVVIMVMPWRSVRRSVGCSGGSWWCCWLRHRYAVSSINFKRLGHRSSSAGSSTSLFLVFMPAVVDTSTSTISLGYYCSPIISILLPFTLPLAQVLIRIRIPLEAHKVGQAHETKEANDDNGGNDGTGHSVRRDQIPIPPSADRSWRSHPTLIQIRRA